ncbi:hypothetical protein QVD99_003609 [Batrachochytrium dendrobatidis]|nr:hypothetical protein QVD99_003609 [Batrachochytrium dendrobatidis]
MKLAVTVLASILFACSVTTATPVNPSATTSAESSISTVTPSAQTIPSIDFSKLSNKDMGLIKKYAKMKKGYDDAEKIHNSLQPKRLSQQELVDRLDEEYEQLMSEFQTSENGSKYSEKLQELEQKLEQEQKTLYELTKKQRNFGFFGFNWRFGKIELQLIKRLFGKNLYQTASYYMELLESNSEFVELVNRLGSSTSSKQLGSQQGFTSGTQSSQHYESPSSSSETSAIQPTQTSSST